MSPNYDHSFNALFQRSNCIQCDNTAPTCPTCKHGEICTMISQSCDRCATTKCVPMSPSAEPPPANPNSAGDRIGAIAGGTIGGVTFVAITVFLAWWLFIRKKRTGQVELPSPEKGNTSAGTRQSIASTVLTRASNVIQIAYIPGVMNRSSPESPDSLIPPVPPLPGAAPNQHFFMPVDLRDSAWSEMSGGRSIAPSLRSSVATTVYRNNAIVSPIPAQQAMLTRPAVVDIGKSNATRTLRPTHLAPSDAPAVPTITPAQLARTGTMEQSSSIVARSMIAKPIVVKLTKGGGDSPASPAIKTAEKQHEPGSSMLASQLASNNEFRHDKSTFDTGTPDEKDALSAGTTKPGVADADPQLSQVLATAGEGPFQDQPAAGTTGTAFAGPFQDQPVAGTTGTAFAVNRQSDSNGSAYRHRKSASSGLLVGDGEGLRYNRSSKMLQRMESPFSDTNELQ